MLEKILDLCDLILKYIGIKKNFSATLYISVKL